MSQYPINDVAGVYEAVNYLASGSGGLGQQFAGFANSDPAYLTGNFRKPYSQPTSANLYIAPIALSSAEMLDGRTFKYTFASAQASPPFALGNGLSISGFTDPIYDTLSGIPDRNTSLVQIGVVECTTTYFILRSVTTFDIHAPETASATVFYYSTATDATADPVNNANFIASDCDVRVNVLGGTQSILVNGQMTLTASYECTATTDFAIVVEIDRYFGFTNNDPTNPDYLFNFDRTLAYKVFTFTVAAGTGTLSVIEQVFSTIVDTAPPGYYRYFINIGLASSATNYADAQITVGELGLRALSASVVKA